MKRLYYFFVNAGKVAFLSTLLLVISVSLYSLTIKGKVNYGNRCYVSFDTELIDKYEYNGIRLLSSYLECNTCYLEYSSDLNEENNLLFLASLSKLFRDNDVDSNFHIIIKTNDYQILSTIVNYNISYTKTLI